MIKLTIGWVEHLDGIWGLELWDTLYNHTDNTNLKVEMKVHRKNILVRGKVFNGQDF